jgi:hypothetical protein
MDIWHKNNKNQTEYLLKDKKWYHYQIGKINLRISL